MTNHRLYGADGAEIALALTFTPSLDRKKIISRLWGGGVHVQVVGTAIERADVHLQVQTMTLLRRVNLAEASGERVCVRYGGVDYYGIIEEAVSWSAVIPGRVYEGNAKIIIE